MQPLAPSNEEEQDFHRRPVRTAVRATRLNIKQKKKKQQKTIKKQIK